MSVHTPFFCRIAAVVAVLAGGPAVAQEKITFLTPAPTNLPSFAAAQLAKAKGYFAAEGITVELVAGRGGADVGKQIGAGNAEAGLMLGDAEILLRPTGVPIKLVAMFGAGGFSFLVAREDSGINVPADLKGKTVSVMTYQDTGTYYSLVGTLASAKLAPADLSIQALGPQLMWQNVVAGKVHACSCPADFAAFIEAAGVKVKLIRHDQYYPALSQGIGVSDKLIAANPKLVGGIVREVIKGADDMRRDPAAAAAAYIEAVPEWKGREAVVVGTIRVLATQVYTGQKRFGEIDPVRLSALQDFFLQHQLIQSKSPVDQLYTNQFVP